jgi:hypothetical protein
VLVRTCRHVQNFVCERRKDPATLAHCGRCLFCVRVLLVPRDLRAVFTDEPLVPGGWWWCWCVVVVLMVVVSGSW